jgi:NADH-quinone oxidoreductase subunit M
MGSFKAYPAFTIIAAVSLVFAGLYGLILIHKALFGNQMLNKSNTIQVH